MSNELNVELAEILRKLYHADITQESYLDGAPTPIVLTAGELKKLEILVLKEMEKK